MRYVILISLMVCYVMESKGQIDSTEIVIRGVVLDVLGKPLEGSIISLFGSEEIERTDGSGIFELDVKKDVSRYSRLMIQHMGYSSVQIPLNEFQGTRYSISVMLSPKRKESRYIIR